MASETHDQRGAARPDDPYSRLNYRRLIAWPKRIAREWPFLESVIATAPSGAVVDLGCGTGEHVRHIASRGLRAVGVDRSAEQIAAARAYEDESPPHGPSFVLGDFRELERLTDERFGVALCLGNVLPHLEPPALAATLAATADRLLPGGRLVLQWLNYERVLSQELRHLPLNFRPHPDGAESEIVFLRLMKEAEPGYVHFYPTTLSLKPGSERPVDVEATKEVRLRAWTAAEVETAARSADLEIEARYGGMTRGAFEPSVSTDVVLVARRPADARPARPGSGTPI